jgi:hypothetical protein
MHRLASSTAVAISKGEIYLRPEDGWDFFREIGSQLL